MKYRLFGIVAAASTLMGIAASAGWSWSQKHHGHFTFHYRGTRYTLHSFEGRITLASPPSIKAERVDRWIDGKSDETAASTDKALAEAISTASTLRNSDVFWKFDTIPHYRELYVSFGFAHADVRLEGLYPERYEPSNGRTRAAVLALLAALEDPDRVVVAHCLLAQLAYWQFASVSLGPQPGAQDRDDARWYFGMLVQRPSRDAAPIAMPYAGEDLVRTWHDAFDQPVISFWYGTIVAMCAIVPLLYLTKPRQRRRRLAKWSFNSLAVLSCAIAIGIVAMRLFEAPPEWVASKVFDSRWHDGPGETDIIIEWYHGTMFVAGINGRV